MATCARACFSSSPAARVGASSWRLFPAGAKFSPALSRAAALGRALFSLSGAPANLSLLKLEFQVTLGSRVCFLVSLRSTTTATPAAARSRAPAGRQQASARKRKASSALAGKSVNGVAKRKDFFKSSDGVALCSDLASTTVKSGKSLSRKETAATSATLDYTSKRGQEFASDQCPAGGDVSWLAARDAREQIEQELFSRGEPWLPGQKRLAGQRGEAGGPGGGGGGGRGRRAARAPRPAPRGGRGGRPAKAKLRPRAFPR